MSDGEYAPGADDQRLDKWLWVARFFKTRSLAAAAVAGGKVQVAGQRVKPARRVRAGDCLQIRRGPMQWDVVVLGVASQRRPAREAALLFEESAESRERREREAERRKLEAGARRIRLGRPSKRERREVSRLKGRDQS
ncbi:MAG: S4 domain-containing protein [Gammaproteobacteria bacterium]|nr:S4 domain-containing protein [Gammaproteobacteria bacterium]